MPDAAETLREIAEALRSGEPAHPVTVREFLTWFGAQRRGYGRAQRIRDALRSAELVTEPDFEGAYIGSEITFSLAPNSAEDADDLQPSLSWAAGSPAGSVSVDTATPLRPLLGGGVADPTYRIAKLAAANRVPISIAPDKSLHEAVTLMMLHDFSQLPVMQGERTVKGVISWQSIGSRLALRCGGESVRDFMDAAAEISADASLFGAIRTIVDRQYVLIRDAQQRIAGIVTTSDLSLRFLQLAEPFLLLGEIENHIRRLIDGKFTLEEVREFRDLGDDPERKVESVTDLTFGEYLRLLENPTMWEKLSLQVDRASFVEQLDRVREIRNDVVHFDPDEIVEDELATLRRFVHFLQTLKSIGAS